MSAPPEKYEAESNGSVDVADAEKTEPAPAYDDSKLLYVACLA
jgi:hypothetical protein